MLQNFDSSILDKETAVNKAQRIQVYYDFLKNEGYLPQLDRDGNIVFKVEGRTYLVLLDEQDEPFFRLVFPNFWRIESEEERHKVERAALIATAGTKVAKIFPISDNTWGTIEMFAATPESVLPVFMRSLSALNTAVMKFVEEMRK